MDQKELLEQFDIVATAAFIARNCFQRVALQFPDELLRYSVAVAGALKKETARQRNSSIADEAENGPVKLFVMADTTFGSCCADEVAAMHADAQCIVHYGNACLSRTSRLPVWYVFGRSAVDAEDCSAQLVDFASKTSKPLLVLYGLDYSHQIPSIQQRTSDIRDADLNITFADSTPQCVMPSLSDRKQETYSEDLTSCTDSKEHDVSGDAGGLEEQTAVTHDGNAIEGSSSHGQAVSSQYSLGGLKWTVRKDTAMDDYVIVWIGEECPGLTNVTLVYNTTTVVRYDCSNRKMVTDVATQSKVLRRRYYYVERAKDANVVGIVVGTLGVEVDYGGLCIRSSVIPDIYRVPQLAGYADVIHRVRKIVESAGKKAYTLVMGKPNPAKLANFPECEVFVLVACPQTALIDSREYLAPLLTPFEAELAFVEGNQWTGAYALDFNTELGHTSTSEKSAETKLDEPRFSFFSGGYVGRSHSGTQDVKDCNSRAIVISNSAEHALQLQANPSSSIITTERGSLDIKSGAEYLAARTYQGLDISEVGNPDLLALPGRKGRAAQYKDEASG